MDYIVIEKFEAGYPNPITLILRNYSVNELTVEKGELVERIEGLNTFTFLIFMLTLGILKILYSFAH